MEKRIFNSLYWRISAAFMILLALVGLAYVYITARSSDKYFEQVNQRLNRSLASDISRNSSLLNNGKVNDSAIGEMFHSIMAINPGLEVYLLDTEGRILTYYAPNRKITLTRINLIPVHKFTNEQGTLFIKGEDPRHPHQQKVFSAAPILAAGKVTGYIYVVLAGDEYDTVIHSLQSNYMLQVGSRAMLVTLLFALVIGLLVFWLVTKNLRKVIDVMQKFRQGNLTARINVRSRGEINELSRMFNEMADILNENFEKLKTLDVLRRELIANISHDLRTPISIIHGYAETLQMKESSLARSDRIHYLNVIYSSTQRLEKLVNELFELSKLEANQVQPNKKPFLISELLNDLGNKYHLLAKEKNITLNTGPYKETQPVYADLSLIERVLQNLIDNALKFTPAGGFILIQAKRNGRGIEVSVSDTGVGIAENERKTVFERYHKGHNGNGRHHGTGLGLAIAKKILDLHGSSLALVSELNKGSSFAFELPLCG